MYSQKSRKYNREINYLNRLSSLVALMPTFEGGIHFLDIKIDRNKTDIYRKDTHTGQYVHFTSFEPWYRKTVWAKCLIERAERICSNKQLLDGQISKIKSFMSWNGYPRYVRNNIIRKLKERKIYPNKILLPRLRILRRSGLECPTLDQLEKNLPNNAQLKSVDTVKKTLSLS